MVFSSIHFLCPRCHSSNFYNTLEKILPVNVIWFLRNKILTDSFYTLNVSATFYILNYSIAAPSVVFLKSRWLPHRWLTCITENRCKLIKLPGIFISWGTQVESRRQIEWKKSEKVFIMLFMVNDAAFVHFDALRAVTLLMQFLWTINSF